MEFLNFRPFSKKIYNFNIKIIFREFFKDLIELITELIVPISVK